MEAWSTILVRYGEIGVKSEPVRRRLEDALSRSILEQVQARQGQCTVLRERGRILLQTPSPDAVRDALEHTFGVVSASPVTAIEPTVEAIVRAVEALAPSLVRPGQRFAIRARRAGSHAFTSLDVARAAGQAVRDTVPDVKVDLNDPEAEIHLEVRQRAAFLHSVRWPGPGGFPVGSQGRVLVRLSGPEDLARAWLLARRGARPVLWLQAGASEALAEPLRAWIPGLKVWTSDADAPEVARRARATAVVPDELDPLGGLPTEVMPAPVRALLEARS